MRLRGLGGAVKVLAVALFVAAVLPLGPVSAQGNLLPACPEPLGVGPLCTGPAEKDAYEAFKNEGDIEKKISLGEQFNQKYPNSTFQEALNGQLALLYFNKPDLPKFFAAADRVLAVNPKDVPVLELVGWVIPRNYTASAPDAAAQLDKAEAYEKRALSLIGAAKKPGGVTEAQFDDSQASVANRAHSGLGMVYFRRKNYADSASELQTAVKQEGSAPDPVDLYILGLDLANLGKASDSADDFAKCSLAQSSVQQDCQKAYEQASHAAAETQEEKDYKAFAADPNPDVQIQLGEKFEQAYASGQYVEAVDSTLAALYQNKQDWPKFFATADKVLAKNPDNAPILALTAWVTPRRYDPQDPNAAASLDKAQKNAEHALDLIGAMAKPANLTTAEFEQSKQGVAARAHSALGAIYFRRDNFADSARELQTESANALLADSFDYYLLGIDLHKLNRDTESVDAFTRCVAIADSLQSQCKRDADSLSQNVAQIANVAAKSLSSAPAPPARDIPPAGASSAAVQESAPLRSETINVPVRVVVRDNKGRAVANLKKENFKVYQDGLLQEIGSFNPVVGARPNAAPPPDAVQMGTGSTGPTTGRGNPVSAYSVPPAGPPPVPAAPHRFLVLFFDDVHMYFADMAQLRTAAGKYLSSLQPEDRLAIVTASGQGELPFTSDRDKLRATIAKLMPHPFPGGSMAPVPTAKCPPPMTYTEADAILEHHSDEVLAMAGRDFAGCYGSGGLADPNAVAGSGQAEATAAAQYAEFAGDSARTAVLDRLEESVRRLALMPGQRVIVLVSPGFIYGKHPARFGEITNLAIHDNVVINALDAKGIAGGGDGRWDPDRFFRQGFGHETEYAVLQDIAEATGGMFVRFNNDYAGVMREMSEPPEAYYMLAYAPQNLALDGKFHVLKVNLTNGVHGAVQARRGFFAPSGNETPQQVAKREIEDTVFSDAEQRDLPVTIKTQLARDGSGAENLNVQAHFDPSRLRFQKSDAKNNEELVITAALFDQNGNYVVGTQKTATMGLDDTTLSQLEKTGFYVELDLAVKPGTYTLHTVARDSNDGRISAETASISVPN